MELRFDLDLIRLTIHSQLWRKISGTSFDLETAGSTGFHFEFGAEIQFGADQVDNSRPLLASDFRY